MALEPLKLSSDITRASAVVGDEVLYAVKDGVSLGIEANILYAGYRETARQVILPVAESTDLEKIGVRTQAIGTSVPIAKTCANTGLLASLKRTGFGADATAAFSAGVYVDGPSLWLGNAADLGGFDATFVFGLEALDASAQTRYFCGLAAEQDPAGLQPSALLNMIGIGCDLADANLQLMVNDGAGAAVKTDTGFPGKTAGQAWKLVLSAEPAAILVTYKVIRLSTGIEFVGTVNLALPANTVFMGPMFYNNNGAGGGAGVTTSLVGFNGMARGY